MEFSHKIAFVIPCYNDGRFIRSAIESAERSEVTPAEIVIVDNGSDDEGTKSVMDELAAAGYRVIHHEGGGPAGARNAGIAASTAEYVIPLDSDNKIRQDFVKKAVDILDARREISVVHSDFQYFGLSDHVCYIEPFDVRKMLYINYIDTCSVFRRDVWEECGGFDESEELRGIEDWEFWLNAYSHGKRFLHLDMIGFDYAWREDSLSSRTKKPEYWRRAEQRLYSKHVMLLKEHYRIYHTWDYHGSELRRRPVRTLFRLFLNALSKRAHDRIYRIRNAENPQEG